MMNDYHMVMSFNNWAEYFFFPVLPPGVELKRKGGGKTYDIVGLGQVNIIHSRELAEISIESFFPASQDIPYLAAEEEIDGRRYSIHRQFSPPLEYVKKLSRWQDSKHPCRFVFTGPQFPINLPVSIEQFDRWEEAGTPGEIHFRLTLREYVFHAARKAEAVQPAGATKPAAPTKRPDERMRPDTYILQNGETLIDAARKLFGDSSRWPELQALNELSDAFLRQRPAGLVLRVPKG